MAEQLGVLAELSAALGALASVYGARGLWRERVQVSLRRLALSRDPRFGNLREQADILNQAGEALLRVGEYVQALPYLFEAEKFGEQIRVADVEWYSLGLQGECWFGLDRWDELLKVEEKWQALTQRYAHEQIGRLCFNLSLRAIVFALRGELKQCRVMREDVTNYMAALNGGPPEIWGRGALY
jgi:tetratricopeptide (TPR) repeat protein